MRNLILTLAALTLWLAAPAAAAPSVSVSPEVVPPGGSITVKGKGWPHNSRVTILIGVPNSEADKVMSLRTTARGRFKGTIRFRDSARQGRYVLLACRKQCAVKATAHFRIAESVGRAAAAARCGYVDITGGRAWNIRATGVGCKRARKLARTCLRGDVAEGWNVTYSPRTDRTRLRSGHRRVSFTLVGGGGCIPV